MVNPVKLGFVFGSLVAIVHIGWVAMVAAGLGQVLADFVFRIHFIAPIYQVQPFDLGRALILVAVAFSGAFVMAALGGAIWNSFNRA
jgi:hypothetical protein